MELCGPKNKQVIIFAKEKRKKRKEKYYPLLISVCNDSHWKIYYYDINNKGYLRKYSAKDYIDMKYLVPLIWFGKRNFLMD